MTAKLKVACIQSNAAGSHEANIAEALRLTRAALEQGDELVSLPEYLSGFGARDGRLDVPVFPEADHPALAAFRAEARRARCWLHLGSLAVRAAKGLPTNRSFVIDPEGSIVARYDKIHLFDVDLGPGKIYRESEVIAPGSEAVLASTPWGGLGLSICYDLRFAALYRLLAQAGACMLAVPAAFTRLTGEAHWHVLNRARAIETGSFVIAACQHGRFPGGGEAYGHSLIVDPWGRILAEGGAGEAVVRAEIDLGEVEAARGRIPALQHDRPFALRRPAPAAAAE